MFTSIESLELMTAKSRREALMKFLNASMVFIVCTIFLAACSGGGSGGGGGGSLLTPSSTVVLTSIDIQAVNTTIPAGVSQGFTAIGNYSDGHSEDITAAVTWGSSDNSVATVNTNGLVTGVSVGSPTIQAQQDSVIGQLAITISNANLNQITLNPSDPELAVGLSRRFVAYGNYSDGSSLVMNGLSWSSSDDTVATINNNGRVTTLSPGNAVISAGDGTISGQTTLHVPSKHLVDIAVEAVDGATQIPVGTTEQYVATGAYDDGSNADISNDVTWVTSDSSIATISGSWVSGVAAGDVMISAKMNSITSIGVPLTVTEVTLESIDVTPTISRVLLGASKQYQAWGNFSDGTVKEITSFAQTKWTSDDTTVARVTKGSVSGRNVGSATITVANRGVETSFTVDIAEINASNISSISVTPENAYVRYSLTQDFTATAIMLATDISGNHFTEDVTDLVTWSISDGNIASVSAAGTVTGVEIGDTILSASYAGLTGQVNLHVVGKSPILQTGQTACYDQNGTELTSCNNTGQDGQFNSGLSFTSRFVRDGDCVIDNATGLMWLKPNLVDNGNPLSATWTTVFSDIDYVNNRCGHSDWRLPNINELRSLVNYEYVNPGQYLELIGLNGAFSSHAWTSTTNIQDFAKTMTITMDDGNDHDSLKFDSVQRAYLYDGWAVRSIDSNSKLPKTGQTVCSDLYGNSAGCNGAGAGQDGDIQAGISWPFPRFFFDSTRNCITDRLTGLTWVKTPDSVSRDWQGALTFANTTSYCGLDGWRLPNLNELASLVHWGVGDSSLNDVNTYLSLQGFSGTYSDYWTSTSYASDPTKAWAMQMQGSGVLYPKPKTNDATAIARAWLVRGRKIVD